MIELKNVEKKLKRKSIIKDISMQIQDGDGIGIVGPNGAGKSTLLKLIATVLKPDQGTIFYNETPYGKAIRDIRQHIGYIPQDIALFEDLTVKDQISFWKKATKKKASYSYVEEMVTSLDLHSVYNQKVKALSGGWKRKLNVCAGMLHDPDVILLDEPTVGVDLAAKDDLLHWLKNLQKNGKTVVLISHEWDVINFICEKIVVVKDGKLLFNDVKENLHHFEQQLTADENEELIKILRQR
nr:ABC transporter ATP-binding protein [Salirhabdus sp. Marseille-P4669]